MGKKTSLILLPVIIAAATSCRNLDFAGLFCPGSAGVDERFGQSMQYNAEHGYPSINVKSDDYKVYVFTDAHIDSTTRNLDAFVSKAIADESDMPVALFLGDMVNCKGSAPRDLFMKATAPLEGKCRLFITAGNHDLYFGEWPGFLSLVHTSSYWFEVKCPAAKDLYICLDSAGGTLGYNQRMWLEDILKEKAGQYRHTIIFTHTHFFRRDTSQSLTSNYSLEETYDLTSLFSKYGVDLILTGHDHTKEDSLFGGVRYVTVQALDERIPAPGYSLCSMGKDIMVDFPSI